MLKYMIDNYILLILNYDVSFLQVIEFYYWFRIPYVLNHFYKFVLRVSLMNLVKFYVNIHIFSLFYLINSLM